MTRTLPSGAHTLPERRPEGKDDLCPWVNRAAREAAPLQAADNI